MIKKLLASIGLGLLIFSPTQIQSTVNAQAKSAQEQICIGAGSTDGTGAPECAKDGGAALTRVIRFVVNIVSIIVGIIATIMIVIGGVKFMTSSGDPSAVNSAKNTVLFSAVGLVVALAAQALIRFVFSRAVG